MEQLLKIIENYVETDEITADLNFRKDLGLASFDTVCMISDIRKAMGITLKPEDFLRCKTVGNLREYIKTL